MKVFTAEQMRAFDKAATEEYGIPSIVLMENAALRVVEFLEMKFAPLKDKRIVVLCGKGNNGGDGFAIARHLKAAFCWVSVILAAKPKNISGDAKTNFQAFQIIAENYSLPLIEAENAWHNERLLKADILVDAFLGTGFKGSIPASHPVVKFAERFLGDWIAVDIPSMLDSQTGDGTFATNADYTVTFVGPKRGMFVRDGITTCGEVWIGDIGVLQREFFEGNPQTNCECITREKASTLLPTRPLDSHKGEAGRVLLIGGSYGMSGAPILAANAVLKSGAGLCIAALPDKILPIFAAAFAEATSHPLPCNEAGQLTEEAMDVLPQYWKNVNAVALGPGIGREASTFNLVQRIVNECPQPLVIDADALYALREIESDLKQREAPTILTPHPGEMGELMEMSTSDVQNTRIETAIACAQKYNAIVVLKGSRSIVALPDGSTYINLTGNSGMATGGTGDVLTGTIAGLLAQTKDAQNATLLGVYLHGLAGDMAYAEKGNGLIAGDVAENLPRALVELQKPTEPPVNARLRKLE